MYRGMGPPSTVRVPCGATRTSACTRWYVAALRRSIPGAACSCTCWATWTSATTVERRCASCPSSPSTTRPEPPSAPQVGAGQWRPQHGVLVQTLLQRQRRHHRPPGMVLLGHRRAEHRHEALTRRRQEGPGVEVQHLLGQPHRLHAVIQPLWTQPGGQGRSLSEPTAEHTDLFVFPYGVGLRRHGHCGGRLGPGGRREGHVCQRRGRTPQGLPALQGAVER